MATQTQTLTATTTTTAATTSSANFLQHASRGSAAAAPPKQDRIKVYKDFLTPALHRRFCSAAGITLLLCLIDSFLLSTSSHLFWSWFPFGPAGLRALLLFMPCLMVFIVRLANMHIGQRTSSSPAQVLYGKLVGAKALASTLNTVFWYWGSAFLFGETYIWSRASTAELVMVDVGDPNWVRPRLNENPIVLRCMFSTLAVAQSVLHFWRDYDRVRIGEDEKEDTSAVSYARGMPTPVRELAARAKTIVARSVNLTIIAICIFPPTIYYTILRRFAWRVTYSFASIFYSDLPSNAAPSGVQHLTLLVPQALFSSFMLVLLWEVSNATFDVFTSQPPLRKGQTLTSQVQDANGVILHKSKDPNGSLLTGLKSKKEVNKAFALWELFLITTQYEVRRKTIFTEVDRSTGSTWSQICKHCLDEVKSVQGRINLANQPAEHQKKQDEQNIRAQQPPVMPHAQVDTGLQRIADRQVINDGDLQSPSRKPDFYNTVGNLARSMGQQPGAHNPILPRAQKAIEWSKDQVLPQEYQERLRPQHLERQASGKLVELLRMPIGIPFRQTFAKKVNAVIFGSPSSQKTTIVHAAKSLSQLAVLSLKEDDYGQAQKDIANITRTFTSTIVAIERYVQEVQPHWTDVEFLQERDRNIAAVEELLDVLKTGLEQILLAFGEYAETLSLSKKEVREAREASIKVPKQPVSEMEQAPAPQRRAQPVPEMEQAPAQQQRAQPRDRNRNKRGLVVPPPSKSLRPQQRM